MRPGGLAGASAAVVFAFLGPVFALIGLGPRTTYLLRGPRVPPTRP